ncbi:MAG: ABC transporter ATP-binding protein [Desulfobulbaceae bacterium]|nr:ABC transporter ATP-binding protein [Desulfobulbaceae bacterium]
MARIRLQNIAHSYVGDTGNLDDFALKKLDLTWDDGGAYALLGPSGCGKSTLLNIISGLLYPTRGKVYFDDREVTTLPTEERNTAQVFQFPVVYDTMTVFDNLAFPLKNRGVDGKEIRRRVTELAEMLDLQNDLKRKAQGLTADVKQKISLGRGLIRKDVNVILFDEPLTVIDPQLKWELRSQLKKLHKQFDFTMIYVTHDQTEALTFADEVVVMYEGEVVQVGTPEELFNRPNHTFVGYFIGSPGMNILPCTVRGDRAVVGKHEIPLGRIYKESTGETKLELGVRPEFLTLSTSSDQGLPVSIGRIDDIGHLRVAQVSLDGLPLSVVVGENEILSGQSGHLVFDTPHANIYADGHLQRGEAV